MRIRLFFLFILLWISPIAFSCAEELIPDNIIDNTEQSSQEIQSYTMSIVADKVFDEAEYSKALSIDNNGKLNTSWLEGESVTVYNETKQSGLSGSLTAQYSGKSTTLRGTLTGIVSKGDELTLKFLSPNYHSQDGTLTGNDTSIDKVCDYSTAQVTVADVTGDIITASGVANFVNQQAIVKFTLRNKDNSSFVSVKPLTVKWGEDVFTITPAEATNEFYVALPAFTSSTITLLGENSNTIYSFEKTDISFERGKYYNITVRLSDQSVMEYIMGNIRKWKVTSPSEEDVSAYLGKMEEDGCFIDVDYSDITNGSKLEPHFDRLLAMSYAYISPQNTFYKSNEIHDKIVKGIEYWIALNPKSTNWYHNQINEPTLFGLMLIAMRAGDQKLPAEVESGVIERWRNNKSNPAERTGSNRSEMALSWLYFACLTESADTLHLSLNYIFEPVAYTDAEGLQVDNSFHQHGPQLYIGGYGEVMLESVLQSAVYVTGTHFSLPSDKLQILRDFVMYSYSQVIRGEAIHWNAIGRQLTRPDFLRYPERRIPIIEMMKEVDVENYPAYTKILNRVKGLTTPDNGVLPFHAHFYRGDYTIHVRPGYSFSTRMLSSRTCRQETINGENLLGYFLSDGATVITSSGREYLDLMPLWDWNRIPGVTAPSIETIPVAPSMSTFGTSVFAGGVSDSEYGCSAYKYYDDFSGVNTGASKGYFFFDDEIVCLGAGITSSHDIVETTVNQCWGNDSFVAGTATGNDVFGGEVNRMDLSGYNWILHNDIGYYFPESQKVFVENKTKEGSWRNISTLWSDETVTGKVFLLGLSHIAPLEGKKYSYHIVPNSNTTSLSNYSKNNSIEILANSDSVQVVYHKGLKLYECVFYRSCSYQGADVIYSDQPCALMIHEQDNSYHVYIADPTQSRKDILIGIKLNGMQEMAYVTCDFTGLDNQYAGITKDFLINVSPSSLTYANANPIMFYSSETNTVKFDKNYRGYLYLSRMDGSIIETKSLESNIVEIHTRMKGMYILKVNLEGYGSIVRKIVI